MVETTARSTQANLASDLSFIQCVANTLNQIGTSSVQVGLMTYGDTSVDIFYLNRYTSLSTLSAAIVTQQANQFVGGNANLANAFTSMLNNYYLTTTGGSRSNRPHVAVLLEHGSAQSGGTSSVTNSAAAISAAAAAKAQCINIIGVGAFINDPNAQSYLSELSAVSSWPNQANYNYYTATTYATLNSQCSAIAQQIITCFQCST